VGTREVNEVAKGSPSDPSDQSAGFSDTGYVARGDKVVPNWNYFAVRVYGKLSLYHGSSKVEHLMIIRTFYDNYYNLVSECWYRQPMNDQRAMKRDVFGVT
jgi:predicted FMN-binding regulatory protein PaiB